MVDWPEALDLDRAKHNIYSEYPGDWYRDPWGWPEITWACERSPEVVYERLEANETKRPAKIDVAKENFGVRPAVVLDPIDRIAYQALVDALSVPLIGDLARHVYGWRLPPDDPARGNYARQDHQWDGFTDALTDGPTTYGAGLMTDVVSCFASISTDRISERILQHERSDLSAKLVTTISSFQSRAPGRGGLPQRSLASAALANLFLGTIDDVLAEFVSEGGRAVRWMDDIWLFANDEGVLRSYEVELQKTMGSVGLAMNLGKTELLVDEELEEAVNSYEHSAVDADLASPRPTGTPLNELIDEILKQPETAPRTTIRFVARRMRTAEMFDRVEDLAQVADRMPHGSDAMARLFRDSGYWAELVDWYPDHIDSRWAAIDWSAAQLGTMFPSSGAMPQDFLDHMAQRLTAEHSLALTSLAAQRLASWDPDRARAAIREALEHSSHPLHRRVLALAAIGAGEGRDLVSQALNEFEETQVTLNMLEDQGWNIPVKADYEGG